MHFVFLENSIISYRLIVPQFSTQAQTDPKIEFSDLEHLLFDTRIAFF